MRTPTRLALVVLAALACQRDPTPRSTKDRSDAPAGTADQLAAPGVSPEFPSRTLTAAGIDIDVPAEWNVLDEADPNFAIAFDSRRLLVGACMLERRRQGFGPLPLGTREVDEGPRRRGYMRGTIRGMIEEFAAPDDPRAWVALHCRAKRSDIELWKKIEAVFLSLRPSASAAAPLPTPARIEQPFVELCSAAPILPGHVCARRSDGAVFCGPGTGPLVRREGPSAVDIGCAGAIACARAEDGSVSCWHGDEPAQPIAALHGALELTDACAVDAGGKLQCVQAAPPAKDTPSDRPHELSVVPLHPFADPSLALDRVRALMPGSRAEQGCVLRDDERVWCWDELRELPMVFREPPVSSDEASGHRRQAPEQVFGLSGAVALERMGDRLCARAATGPWRCRDIAGQIFEPTSCAEQPCGCTLIGATAFSCEDQPESRIDSLPQGRITGVVARAEPCALTAEGRVICRIPGRTDTHVLEPGAPALPPSGEPEPAHE